MNLRNFIDQLEIIYKEAKSSGHTQGNYPPEVQFYLDEEHSYCELIIKEMEENRAVCCNDVLGLDISFVRKNGK